MIRRKLIEARNAAGRALLLLLGAGVWWLVHGWLNARALDRGFSAAAARAVDDGPVCRG